ncbi:MAG: hypothetical protein GY799_11735 [Desulfobulbaceae bacterium]|nr:hypothetical protein [Desulfobulbaceae bacterium]
MCKENKTFIDLCLEGLVLLEQIDDFIDQWHDGNSQKSLYEYLGLTRDEYAIFVEDPEHLSSILMSRRFNISLPICLEYQGNHAIAARAKNPHEGKKVLAWFQETRKLS